MTKSMAALTIKIAQAISEGKAVTEVQQLVVDMPGHIVVLIDGGIFYEIVITRQKEELTLCGIPLSAFWDALYRLFGIANPMGVAEALRYPT